MTKMDYKLFLLFLVSIFFVAAVAENEYQKRQGCSVNEYFNAETKQCTACTFCQTNNNIIREPCTPFSDTVCGPFEEFDMFHQAPIINLLPNHNESTNVLVTGTFGSGRGNYESTKAQGNVPIEIVKDGRWYTLAMALVGVLSIVSMIVVVYIIVYCFVCRKPREEKELIYYPELCTSVPETPRQHTSRMTSRDRLKKHIVTYTEEGDEVSNRLVSMPNSYIPIPGTDVIADNETENSGQTVSSSSTNYVYFKAPSENV